MFKKIKEEVKAWKAIKSLRASLSHFKEIENVSDKDLELWVREHITRLGTHEIVSPKVIPSYIKVEQAAPKDDTTKEDLFMKLCEVYGLIPDDLDTILEKCKGDLVKMSNVVQIMAITFDSDDNVLRNYQTLYDQLRYKLKLL